jgi:DNA helicase II / ATP-dependent DNA helicase PcrA
MIGNGIRDRLNEIAQHNGRAWQAQSFYFEDALSTDAAADGFALPTLLVDPEDRPALRYWLGEHAQDCRWRPYARLGAHCGNSGQSPRAALQNMAAGTLTLPHTASLVARFNILTQRLNALMALDLAALVDTLFPDGNDDVTSVRQVALLTLPNVNTPPRTS